MYQARVIRTDIGGPWLSRPIAKGNSIEEVKEALKNDEHFLINRYKNDGHFYGIYFEEGTYDEGDGYLEPYSEQHLIVGVIEEAV